MYPAYLMAESARTRLIATGVYTVESAPSVAAIADLLTSLEIRLDGWLGRRMAVEEYTERLIANSNGVALMRHYPVIDVLEAWWYRDAFPGHEQTGSPNPISVSTVWRQNRNLQFPLAGTPIRVTYRAGYDPVPPVFGQTMYQLLKVVISKGGLDFSDLSFLDEPVKDVASLSVPGGISKTFRVGGSAAANGADSSKDGSTILGRILAPLDRYRKRFTC